MAVVDLEAMLRAAVAAAEQAGRVITVMRQQNSVTLEHKDGVEPVTSADLASDEVLRESLRQTIVGCRVVSEESVEPAWDAQDLNGPIWIVDPIDGTANYAHGHPYVAISVALAVDGVVMAGVVHAPFLGETFTAVKGGGAKLNGHPIRTGTVTELRRAIVSTGFPHRRHDVEPLVERVRRLLLHCQDIRRAASPALDIAWVAAGRLDAHTETLAPWDVAAAGLIATEAGAVRSHMGPPSHIAPDLRGDGFLVSAPGIHDDLVSLLSP